jgi:hypothetical protein
MLIVVSVAVTATVSASVAPWYEISKGLKQKFEMLAVRS